MKPVTAMACSLILACASFSAEAEAAPHLTQAECHAYPFTRPAHPLTHQDVMRQFNELVAAGWQPSANEWDYPNDLDRAQAKLGAEYKRDCQGLSMPAAAAK